MAAAGWIQPAEINGHAQQHLQHRYTQCWTLDTLALTTSGRAHANTKQISTFAKIIQEQISSGLRRQGRIWHLHGDEQTDQQRSSCCCSNWGKACALGAV